MASFVFCTTRSVHNTRFKPLYIWKQLKEAVKLIIAEAMTQKGQALPIVACAQGQEIAQSCAPDMILKRARIMFSYLKQEQKSPAKNSAKYDAEQWLFAEFPA